MSRFLILLYPALYCALCSTQVWAWGRHDLITGFTLENSHLVQAKTTKITAESIEVAAPDLLTRVLPELQKWAVLYHKEYDLRFPWSTPPTPLLFDHPLTPRETLLWGLEDNIFATLETPEVATGPTSAAAILIRYVEEPDGLLDANLNVSPYLERLRARMGLFYDGSAHTHPFRHFYVPDSWIPPLSTPRGEAPYQAALYAKLSILSFKAGHRYWGYRFLAWSIHYAQDVTQPWHTVFVPSISYLRLSTKKMRREISAFHFLTEALADSWMLRTGLKAFAAKHAARVLSGQQRDSYYVAELVEDAARRSHAVAEALSKEARPLFEPILAHLGDDLKPLVSTLSYGGMSFSTAALDFTGQGAGATAFLAPIWEPGFRLAQARDQVIGEVTQVLAQGIELSQRIIEYVLEESGELKNQQQ